MEAGEYGVTRGTCFLACRLELDALAGLLLISWCVLGGTDFSVFFFLDLFSFQRTRPTASMKTPCLIYLSFSTDCESCTRPISTNPGSIETVECGLPKAWDVFRRMPFRGGRGRRAAVDFVVCSGCAEVSCGELSFLFSSNTHDLLQV